MTLKEAERLAKKEIRKHKLNKIYEFRFIKKYGDKVEIISFWKYVWENGKMNDKETNLIYHFRGLHKE